MELRDKDGINIETSNENSLRIKNDDPTLARLIVCPPYRSQYPRPSPFRVNTISGSKIGKVGRYIKNNTHLSELELNGKGDGDAQESDDIEERRAKFQLSCARLCIGINQNKTIKRLVFGEFGHNDFGEKCCQMLSPFFENNSSLQYINVQGGLTCEGIRSLAAPLARRQNPLNELDLHYSEIDDDSVEELFTAFCENPALTPKKINLEIKDIGRNGYNSIVRLLRDPMCTLEELLLGGNMQINDDIAISFANSLVTNKSLIRLCFGDTVITLSGLGAFIQSLCSKACINRTYSSNHTLRFLNFNVPEELDQYLMMNMNEDKEVVARRKVLMHHFSGNFSILPFKGFGAELLTRVYNFITRELSEEDSSRYDIPRFSILFELIRNNPEIAREIKKPGKIEGCNARKRKRALS